jgi:hypothetical protein
MGELDVYVGFYISLHRLPIVFVVPDPFAIRADGQEASELEQFADIFHNQNGIGLAFVYQWRGSHQDMQLDEFPVLEQLHLRFVSCYLPPFYGVGNGVPYNAIFAKFRMAATARVFGGMDAAQGIPPSLPENTLQDKTEDFRGRQIQIEDTNVIVHDEYGGWNGVEEILKKLVIFKKKWVHEGFQGRLELSPFADFKELTSNTEHRNEE